MSVLGAKHPLDGLPLPQHPKPGCLALPQDRWQGFPGVLPPPLLGLLLSAPAPTHSGGSRHRPFSPCHVQHPTPAVPSPPRERSTGSFCPAQGGLGTQPRLLTRFFSGAGGLPPTALRADEAGSRTVQAERCQQCLPRARQVLALRLPRQGHSAGWCRTDLSPNPGSTPLLPALPRTPHCPSPSRASTCNCERDAAGVPLLLQPQHRHDLCSDFSQCLLSSRSSCPCTLLGTLPRCVLLGGRGHHHAASLPHQGGQGAGSHPHHGSSPPFIPLPALGPGSKLSLQPQDRKARGPAWGLRPPFPQGGGVRR